jgi:CheY-like chemotaxis protein
VKDILVIDDDATARDIVRALLEPMGYRVTTAADGREGLRLFRGHPYDLVVLDLFMPGMDGLDALEAIDPEASGVPVVAISGGGRETGTDPLVLAATLGAARTFTKDFDFEEFVRAVDELTGMAPAGA